MSDPADNAKFVMAISAKFNPTSADGNIILFSGDQVLAVSKSISVPICCSFEIYTEQVYSKCLSLLAC